MDLDHFDVRLEDCRPAQVLCTVAMSDLDRLIFAERPNAVRIVVHRTQRDEPGLLKAKIETPSTRKERYGSESAGVFRHTYSSLPIEAHI